nr:type I-E CRISPR-associated protein Cse2/CasB [Streptomyces sp. NBC_00857]
MSTATAGPDSPGNTSPGDAPSDQRHPSLESHDAFVRAVRGECRVPGSQQALRRALGKTVDEVPPRTHAVLLRKGLVPDGATGDARRAHYAVAALIAARPRAERVADREPSTEQPTTGEPDEEGTEVEDSGTSPETTTGFSPRGTSLGQSLALATLRREPTSITHDPEDTDSLKVSGLESRLHLMTRQDVDGIHRMLPSVLRQLGSAEVPVDYARLLKDLTAWRWYRNSVTTDWLTDYYRTLNRERAATKKKAKQERQPPSP